MIQTHLACHPFEFVPNLYDFHFLKPRASRIIQGPTKRRQLVKTKSIPSKNIVVSNSTRIKIELDSIKKTPNS